MTRRRCNAARNAAIAAVLDAGISETGAAALRGVHVHRDPSGGRLVLQLRHGPGRVETVLLSIEQHLALLAHLEVAHVYQRDVPLFTGQRGALTSMGIGQAARRHRRGRRRVA